MLKFSLMLKILAKVPFVRLSAMSQPPTGMKKLLQFQDGMYILYN